MKENYEAWELAYGDFPLQGPLEAQLRFLIRFAVLAPSSHNSQPWRFVIGTNTIDVFIDETRIIPVADPHNRLVLMGVACALENIVVAADYYRMKPMVIYFPEGNAVARVTCVSGKNVQERKDHLIFTIPRRRTNRERYALTMPPASFLKTITSLADNGVEVMAVFEERRRSLITDLLLGFRDKAFANNAFRGEIADYKRTNFTRSFLGMPGFTMGFSNIASLFAPLIIRFVNVMKFIRPTEEALLKKHTPVFIFINSKADSPVDWLRAGRLFQRIALQAEQVGIQTGINALPRQSTELQQLLGSRYIPQVFFRMGYTEARPGHSPRLPAEKVVSS